jgi:hypothetical protein
MDPSSPIGAVRCRKSWWMPRFLDQTERMSAQGFEEPFTIGLAAYYLSCFLDAIEFGESQNSLPPFPAPIACSNVAGHAVARLTCQCRVSRTNCWKGSICPLVCRRSRLERLLSLCYPQRSRVFALIALELLGDPEQRAKNDRAVVAGQVHDASFQDEPPSSMRCRVRSRRSTCHVRMSCRALAA